MRFTLCLLFILFSLMVHAQLAEPFQDANGKWGYKYKDGKVDVVPLYDIAMPYNSGGFAEVNIGRQYKIVKGKKIMISPGKWGVLHYYRGLIVQPQYDGMMSQISNYFSFNVGAFVNEEGFITGGKWGIINCDKNSIMVQPQYEFISDYNSMDSILTVCKGGKILYNGKLVMPEQNSKGRWGLVNIQGTQLSPFNFSLIRNLVPYLYIMEDAKTKLLGMYSYKGKEISTCVYDSIFGFAYDDKVACAVKNKKYGFINQKNEILVPFEYDKVSRKEFDGGIIMVKKDGKEFLIDNTGQTMKPTPEPYETTFQNAFKLANNSTERAKALFEYEKGLQNLKYTDGQILYLLSQKFTQAVEIDYYSVFQALMKCDRSRIMIFSKAMLALTQQQRAGIKALSQYTIDEFSASQNNTAKPSYPAGVPQPGYGWGKTVSSDKATYQPPVSNTSTSSNSNVAKSRVSEYQAKSLIGKYFTYEKKSTDYNVFDPRSVKVESFVMKIVGLTETSTPESPKYKIRYTKRYGCYAYSDEIDAEKLFYVFDGIYYNNFDGFATCSNCNGAGRWSSSYSHTNDYQYTLGAKITYSGTYSTNCKKCGGSGKANYKSHEIDCL